MKILSSVYSFIYDVKTGYIKANICLQKRVNQKGRKKRFFQTRYQFVAIIASLYTAEKLCIGGEFKKCNSLFFVLCDADEYYSKSYEVSSN
jgi:hypothetical protein